MTADSLIDIRSTPLSNDEANRIRLEAATSLHLAALRRQYDAIRHMFGDAPPHRSREALWVTLEVTVAHHRGERMAFKDLVALANGLLSAPTLSRVVCDLERGGFLLSDASAQDKRLKLLRPTDRALQFIASRGTSAFEDFSAIVGDAERRLGSGAAEEHEHAPKA